MTALKHFDRSEPAQDSELEAGYRIMAADEAREAEALEWAKATVGDVCHEEQ